MSVIGGIGVPSISGSCPGGSLVNTEVEIAPVLAFIFQQSYDTSQVPSDWQFANVTAVFKKGEKTNPAT
jgi:hypothetical protein